MDRIVRIAERFRGPPASGNGGYVAGLVAEALGGSDVEVTLRRPPPLEQDLRLRFENRAASLWDGAELVAAAEPRPLDLEPPEPPGLAAAEAASARFAGFEHHVFPGCFVCGPERAPGDGLRIFAGDAEGALVASPWIPASDLCDRDGRLRLPFLWAALDCPGYFAVRNQAGPAVLGRLAVKVSRPAQCGEPLVVAGWHIASDGRKHKAGTALYAAGAPIACAEATWISIPLRSSGDAGS